MTNKELEKLFQNKLGGRKVDFDPEAWESMERLLDSKMPITPWYVAVGAWVKGITAAMVVGFSGYFLAIEPAQNSVDSLNGNPQIEELNTTNTPTKQDANNQGSKLELENNDSDKDGIGEGFNVESSELANSSQADKNQRKDKTASNKNNRRRSKQKRQETFVVSERFVSEDNLNSKATPTLKTAYVEPALLDDNNASEYKPKHKRSKASPLKFGVSFSAISAKNLLPTPEGILNTSMVPAFALGIDLAQPLSARFGLGLGLNYRWQKAEGSYVMHDINYGFGEEHTFTQVSYNALHSLEIPLEAYYLLNEKHQVNLGLFASYLWAANYSYNRETRLPFGLVKENGNFSNNDAIKDVWDYGFTAGYFYSLNSRFKLGLESWVGLTPLQYDVNHDLKSNSFQLRFSLNYWLF